MNREENIRKHEVRSTKSEFCHIEGGTTERSVLGIKEQCKFSSFMKGGLSLFGMTENITAQSSQLTARGYKNENPTVLYNKHLVINHLKSAGTVLSSTKTTEPARYLLKNWQLGLANFSH